VGPIAGGSRLIIIVRTLPTSWPGPLSLLLRSDAANTLPCLSDPTLPTRILALLGSCFAVIGMKLLRAVEVVLSPRRRRRCCCFGRTPHRSCMAKRRRLEGRIGTSRRLGGRIGAYTSEWALLALPYLGQHNKNTDIYVVSVFVLLYQGVRGSWCYN
jgi:hypothetical protein